MRLFIALPLPATVRERLEGTQAIAHRLGLPLRLARAEGLHLTLAFLGETAESRVDALRALMEEAARRAAPFRLELAGLGAFPSARRPRVLWAGLAGDLAELARLHAALSDRLADAGFRVEAREFRPHITLGRSTGEWTTAQSEALSRLLDAPASATGSWNADALHLMRSELRREGAKYTTLYTSPLVGERERV
jgi:2'-5' RNA ligase